MRWIVIVLTLLVVSCNSRPDQPARSPKFEQYYNQGEQLYAAHCSNCHQKNGAGLGRVYPPLNVSDFVDDRFEEVICLMKYGRSGEITVNGTMFNQSMPAPNLTDLEIAEIATYIYNTWGRQRDIVDVRNVSQVLQRCDSIAAQ